MMSRDDAAQRSHGIRRSPLTEVMVDSLMALDAMSTHSLVDDHFLGCHRYGTVIAPHKILKTGEYAQI